jgi:hypothetical protein
LLLSDIRRVFDARKEDRLPTKTVLADLHALDDSDWCESRSVRGDQQGAHAGRVWPKGLPSRKRNGPDHAIRGAEGQSTRRGPRGIFRSSATGSPLAGPRNCTAQIVASSVSRTSPRASTPASKWCAFLSVAARGRRDGRHMKRVRSSRMVSAFAPASRDASPCCFEAAA